MNSQVTDEQSWRAALKAAAAFIEREFEEAPYNDGLPVVPCNALVEGILALSAPQEQTPDPTQHVSNDCVECLRVERDAAIAKSQQPASADKDAVRWAASKWDDEVANRPLVNVHRRSLDDAWRQVIRHFGGDDVSLCGPRHDDLIALQSQPQQVTK